MKSEIINNFKTMTKTINLQREIKTIRGETYSMSFPSKTDIEKVKEEKGIKEVKLEDMPRETVQNVIVNSLANYVIKESKDVFMLQIIATWVMSESEEKEDMPKKAFDFLVKEVLPAAVSREEEEEGKKVAKGTYSHWVMVQVYDELGVKE